MKVIVIHEFGNPNVLKLQDVARPALEAVGPSQILFGTDDPFIDANTSHVDQLSLPDRDREAIMGGNAARLLKRAT